MECELMQWLIDIIAEKVIDTIGVPPVIVDRGSAAASDLTLADLTADDNWHTISLSSIVPANAQSVIIAAIIAAPGASTLAKFRKGGETSIFNVATLSTQSANVGMATDIILALNANKEIDYNLSAGLTFISLTVKGWTI